MESVDVRLLGGFEVRVDGEAVPASAWTHGRARDLVKLLALAPARRLPRERVVDELWGRLEPDAGLANLHKAAHHARRAVGHAEAVVLRERQVMLAPDARVDTDVERFEASGEPGLYTGELLPDDRYAPWLDERRAHLRARYLDGLRTAGRWEDLVAADPAEESAQRALMLKRLALGDRAGALRGFEQLSRALEELRLRPGVETLAVHARIAGGRALDSALAAVEGAIAQAAVAERAQLLATRADLLMQMADRSAPAAYAEAAAAAGGEGMALRIRQAWAQLATGDPAAAQATLAPLAPRSPGERASHLVAQAAAAWFRGDLEAARSAAAEAQPLAIAAGLAPDARTAILVQAMVAHTTGAWPESLQVDLAASLRAPHLADTLFDGHLCVAEYALSRGEGSEHIREVSQALHATAVRSGARRAQVFAATLLGEAALLAGQTGEADERLREAVRVSREISAVSAEALAGVRLGEVARAQGRQAEADTLLADAIVIAGWSPLSGHLQPLAHAAAIRATDEPEVAGERLEYAEACLRGELVCAYCGMVFRVAAAVTAARTGQPDRAAAFLAAAESAPELYRGGSWPSAMEEARGEIAHARGETPVAHTCLQAASDGFARHGRILDDQRVQARLVALV